MKCPFKIKVCSRCKRILIAYEGNFGIYKNNKDGLRNICRECRRLESKKYYENNKEEILEKCKEYYENNKDKKRERSKKYREENKDKIKEGNKKYYEENKERILRKNKKYYEENKDKIKEKSKQYYEDNKEEICKRCKEYRKNNPQVDFNNHTKRRQREENQGSGFTKEQWYQMMMFFDFKCAYSGEYIGGDSKYRTIDHIVPLDKNGEHEIWNLVPMHLSYNSSKRTNDMLEWYMKQDFFSEERLQKIYEWIEYAYNKYYR